MGLGLYFASTGHLGRLKEVKSWASATLIQCAGWLVYGVLRKILPYELSFIVGNLLLTFSLIYYYNIIVVFFREKARWKTAFFLLLSELIVLLLLVINDSSQSYKVFFVSLFGCIPLLGSAYEILKSQAHRGKSNLYTGVLFSILGFFLIFRSIYYLTGDINPDESIFWKSTIQDITFLLFYLMSVILTFGFILMCIDRFMSEQIESERKYRLLAENSSDVIWVYNLNKKMLTYISPSVYQLRGFTAEEAIKEPIEIGLTKESAEKIKYILQERIQKFESDGFVSLPYLDEFQQPCKDGRIIWIEAVTSLRKGEDGSIEVLGVSRNIEKRKKVEQEIQTYLSELKELNSTKDKFLSIIAHDLKGPVGGMNTFIKMILEELDIQPLKKTRQELLLLEESTKDVLSLLENLLTWARSQKDGLNFEPRLQSLYTTVTSCFQVFASIAENKKVTLENKILVNEVVFADEKMLQTIVRNILGNSIKYSKEDGNVTITARNFHEFTEVCITDNGIGMSKRTASKLFKLDEKQASLPGTMGERGTGLGLILCKELIDKHGGRIRVESEEGLGSTFYFTLPKNMNYNSFSPV